MNYSEWINQVMQMTRHEKRINEQSERVKSLFRDGYSPLKAAMVLIMGAEG